MKIFTESMRTCREGPEAWFTGAVWFEEVMKAAPPASFKAVWVTFEPSARTAWHTHPMGQALHVLAGTCLVQLKGQPIQQVRSGDSIWIEANELHWHGATPQRTMVHIAMQQPDEHGVDVVWLEHVTDEEYSQPPV